MLKALSKLVKKVTSNPEKQVVTKTDEAPVQDKVVVKKNTKLGRAVKAAKKKP